MKTLAYITVIFFFCVGYTQAGASTPSPYQTVTFGYFYDHLQAHGDWIELDDRLIVWRPRFTRHGWAPYQRGSWIWTNYGWYWDSYDSFGYIAYHYGRWYYDDYYGWIWIPDYEWAPAWVEWRYDDEYIGWAPLPPYAMYHRQHGISYSAAYTIGYHHWNFIKYRNFCRQNVYSYMIQSNEKYRVFARTKVRNEYSYRNNGIVNHGIERDFIRQRGGDGMREREIVFTNSENVRTRQSQVGNTRIEVGIPADNSNNTEARDMKISRGERTSSINTADVSLTSREDMRRIRENSQSQQNVRQAPKAENSNREQTRIEPGTGNKQQVREERQIDRPKREEIRERVRDNQEKRENDVRQFENQKDRSRQSVPEVRTEKQNPRGSRESVQKQETRNSETRRMDRARTQDNREPSRESGTRVNEENPRTRSR
jgi:hypothetical protein